MTNFRLFEQKGWILSLRHAGAWMLCFSFFYLVPLELANLAWEKTPEGLWRLGEDGSGSIGYSWQYTGWIGVSLVGSLLFSLTGVISGFFWERKSIAQPFRLQDVIYYFAWVQFLTLLFLIFYYAMVPVDIVQGNAGEPIGLIAPFFPHLLMLGVSLIVFRNRLAALGFMWFSWRKAGVALAVILILYFMMFFFLDPWVTHPIAKWFNLELQSWREESITEGIRLASRQGWIPVILQVSFLSVIGPVAEEVLFRGVLLRGMMQRMHAGFSVFLSALLFSLFHVDVVYLAPLFVMGLILGSLYVWFRNLWVPIFFHIINNGVAVAMDLIHHSY